MRKLFTALCAVLFVFGTVRLAGATLEFYSDRGTFNAANPDLPVEDFEEGNLPGIGLAVVPAPLDSSSNNGVFSPGDILDGVRFQDNPSPNIDAFGFALIGSDFSVWPMPSKTLFINFYYDTLDIFFDGGGVVAVGMDVFSLPLSSQVDISIYGVGGLLGSSSVDALSDGTPTFWGVFSDAELITWINLTSTGGEGGQMEGIDNIAFSTPVQELSTLLLDIKPQSCPNPINTKSKGVLPAAILGTGDFHVTDIAVASIRLEGVAPIRSSVEDVSTPVFDPQDDCECNEEGSDGFDDLTLKFDTQEIVNALSDISDGDVVELTLTGELLDGTPIEETDCIVVLDRGGGRSK